MIDRYQITRTLRRGSRLDLIMKFTRYLVMRVDLVLFCLKSRWLRDLPRPVFLVIGAQKSGTTWLHEVLKQSNRVQLPQSKELHFFDRGFDWTVARYLRHFDSAMPSGEITPDYCALDRQTIRHLRAIMPHVKILLMVREPLERAWSAVRMELGLEEGRQPADIPEAEMVRCLLSARTLKRTDYARMLDNWLAVFPPEQVLVLDYGRIGNDPEQVLKEIADFLRLPPFDTAPAILRRRVFAGQPAPLPVGVRARVIETYEDLGKRAKECLGRLGLRVPWECPESNVAQSS